MLPAPRPSVIYDYPESSAAAARSCAPVPAAAQQGEPRPPVPLECSHPAAPSPTHEVSFVQGAVMVAPERDRRGINERLQLLAADLRVYAPPESLVLEIQPRLEAATICLSCSILRNRRGETSRRRYPPWLIWLGSSSPPYSPSLGGLRSALSRNCSRARRVSATRRLGA
jgi:hypothetical protein